jgi:hypothetical protein
MATRRPARRDRAALSHQRALNRRELEIEVHETLRRLIVTMPGTNYAMEFAPVNDRLGVVSGFGPDDKRAQISCLEFAALAEKAATEKARELGWSAQRGPASRAWVDKISKR